MNTDSIIGADKTNPQYKYSTNPNGKMGWFYWLFGKCFAKPFLKNETYYHKVCCFQYSTDGLSSQGIYEAPDKKYPHDETDLYTPEEQLCPLILCGICLYYRFEKYNKNYKKYGQTHADYIYYTLERHYNHDQLCSLYYVDY